MYARVSRCPIPTPAVFAAYQNFLESTWQHKADCLWEERGYFSWYLSGPNLNHSSVFQRPCGFLWWLGVALHLASIVTMCCFWRALGIIQLFSIPYPLAG